MKLQPGDVTYLSNTAFLGREISVDWPSCLFLCAGLSRTGQGAIDVSRQCMPETEERSRFGAKFVSKKINFPTNLICGKLSCLGSTERGKKHSPGEPKEEDGLQRAQKKTCGPKTMTVFFL